ncbi:hypothetical protein HPB50_010870 [Hyalomma asiaticum]|uniref:Uncharacterized protein n=1 Tax=Hyalomma asiaticum TaxID=266040 RepID=A0ACB7RMT0_HYAAI|nr:hypothetical protein HPB50_010870 [Hyalomma asiaticum]
MHKETRVSCNAAAPSTRGHRGIQVASTVRRRVTAQHSLLQSDGSTAFLAKKASFRSARTTPPELGTGRKMDAPLIPWDRDGPGFTPLVPRDGGTRQQSCAGNSPGTTLTDTHTLTSARTLRGSVERSFGRQVQRGAAAGLSVGLCAAALSTDAVRRPGKRDRGREAVRRRRYGHKNDVSSPFSYLLVESCRRMRRYLLSAPMTGNGRVVVVAWSSRWCAGDAGTATAGSSTHSRTYGALQATLSPPPSPPPLPWVKQVQRLFCALLRHAAAEILLCVSDCQGGGFRAAFCEGASVAFLEPFLLDTGDAQHCVRQHGRGFRGKRTSAGHAFVP